MGGEAKLALIQSVSDLISREFASVQAPVLGGVLLTSAVLKFRRHADGSTAAQTALALLVGKDHARAAWLFIGFVEAMVAVSLFLLPGDRLPLVAAAGLMLSADVYVIWALRKAPTSSCGCFSSDTTVSKRALLRTSCFLAAALLGAAYAHPWTSATPLTWPVLAAELVIIAWLSDEIRRPIRAVAQIVELRLAYGIVWRNRAGQILSHLQASEVWRSLRPYLQSDRPNDTWREGCWRFVSFPAFCGGKTATAVFALPLLPRVATLRASVVAETTTDPGYRDVANDVAEQISVGAR